ncbi:MAG TPA: nucleotide exchange factor GrpE [Spirochaetia bacterium]|nr:nucleotide exchange factor GrpE [Spirochaetia bacterium]
MSRENGDRPAAEEDSTPSEFGEDAVNVPQQQAESGEGEPAAVPQEDFEARLQELEIQKNELNDQLLRKQADFENFRKRIFREKEDAIKFANSDLLTDLISIIDDFERAIRSSEESKDFDSLHAGIEMIEKQFTSMLERKYGLKRFESTGEEFDPERHQAISVGDKLPDAQAQVVLEDYQKGYMLHDRVLRPAKVKVSLEPAGNAQNDEIEGDK